MISQPVARRVRLVVLTVLAAAALVSCGAPGAVSMKFSNNGGAALNALPYGPDTCKQGYVWREARSSDHVCVVPTDRDLVASENAAAANFREPGGGAYGSNTCRQGYVWREAFDGDVVCVTPERRARVKADNAAAAGRRATETSSGGATSPGGTTGKDALSVSGSASGTITDVAVTCTSSGGYLSWELKGSLNGSKVTLNYTTNNYRGAGSYNTTTITDNQGGQLTWYVGDVGKAVSNGADTGKFVIGADLTSGSVDAQIGGDYVVRVSGPWKCS